MAEDCDGLTAVRPEDSDAAATNTDIHVRFGREVQKGEAGSARVVNLEDGDSVREWTIDGTNDEDIVVEGNEAVLSADAPYLEPHSEYVVEIDHGFIRDTTGLTGNEFHGTSDGCWTFSTGNTVDTEPVAAAWEGVAGPGGAEFVGTVSPSFLLLLGLLFVGVLAPIWWFLSRRRSLQRSSAAPFSISQAIATGVERLASTRSLGLVVSLAVIQLPQRVRPVFEVNPAYDTQPDFLFFGEPIWVPFPVPESVLIPFFLLLVFGRVAAVLATPLVFVLVARFTAGRPLRGAADRITRNVGSAWGRTLLVFLGFLVVWTAWSILVLSSSEFLPYVIELVLTAPPAFALTSGVVFAALFIGLDDDSTVTAVRKTARLFVWAPLRLMVLGALFFLPIFAGQFLRMDFIGYALWLSFLPLDEWAIPFGQPYIGVVGTAIVATGVVAGFHVFSVVHDEVEGTLDADREAG